MVGKMKRKRKIVNHVKKEVDNEREDGKQQQDHEELKWNSYPIHAKTHKRQSELEMLLQHSMPDPYLPFRSSSKLPWLHRCATNIRLVIQFRTHGQIQRAKYSLNRVLDMGIA